MTTSKDTFNWAFKLLLYVVISKSWVRIMNFSRRKVFNCNGYLKVKQTKTHYIFIRNFIISELFSRKSLLSLHQIINCIQKTHQKGCLDNWKKRWIWWYNKVQFRDEKRAGERSNWVYIEWSGSAGMCQMKWLQPSASIFVDFLVRSGEKVSFSCGDQSSPPLLHN